METLFVHSASLSVINGQIFRLLLNISVEEKKKNETIEHFFWLSDFAELFNQQKKSSTENRYNYEDLRFHRARLNATIGVARTHVAVTCQRAWVAVPHASGSLWSTKVDGNTLCALCFSSSHQRTNLSPFTKDFRGREEKNETIEHFFRLSDFAELFNQQKKSSTENRYN